MNPTEILRHVASLGDDERRTVWFLQSRFIADGGFDKLAAEILSQRAEQLSKVNCNSFRQMFEGGNLGVDCCELVSALTAYFHSGRVVSSKLLEIFAEYAANATGRDFYLTNIGKQVWETLDWCREERRPCFIEGREGRGKTSAARAWHDAHRGESRYVSLPGLRTQRDFFEALATAYGVAFSVAKAPNEIRFRVRDIIVRSGLILILDEAHHALPERHRAGRPPLIDWIDCDLCNAGVPVVLVSTPQFGPLLSEFEDRTKWNAGQFRRRFSGRWTRLPNQTDESDLFALAAKALPHVGSKGIKLAAGYAGTFGRDVSGLFDLVRDAERRARKAGRASVSYQDLRDAYELDRVPTENAMANAFKRPSSAPIGAAEVLPEAGESTAAELQRNRFRIGDDGVSPQRSEELRGGLAARQIAAI